MRLGIDLGTTHTVVALADRGNYPVVPFLDLDGDVHEFLPSVVALRPDGSLASGFEALEAERTGAPTLRSFKRLLGDPGATGDSETALGDRTITLLDLTTAYLTDLREQVRAQLAGSISPDEPLEAVVSVPAHAHTAQRFLTLEAFARAGFAVVAMINEPSAAGLEFTHRQTRALSSRRTQVLVYDLGGGTFDASLVEAEGERHDVIGSVGINRLGGDDFDAVLAQTVLGTVTRAEGEEPRLSRAQWRELVEACRTAKEGLSPQTRRMVVELGDRDVVVAVDAFYAAAAELVEASVEAMEPLVGRLDEQSLSALMAAVAGMYLVGGASGLPLVARVLRERFGRRVHRSPYPGAATAIGLAIAADPHSRYTLRDRVSRALGVFREWDSGRALAVDEVIGAATELPEREPVTVTRCYRPVHDLGVFRYVEYQRVDAAGQPVGELVPVAEVRFPFTRGLQVLASDDEAALAAHEPRRLGPGEGAGLIEEAYTLWPDGRVELTITDLESGYRFSTAPTDRSSVAVRPLARR
ncbi:Hsp70 family protein [Salana multivorans]